MRLRDRLLAMGSLAETMIHKGIKALVDRDAALGAGGPGP